MVEFIGLFLLKSFKGCLNQNKIVETEDDLMDLTKEVQQSSLPEMLIASHDLNRKEFFKLKKMEILLIVND